MKEYSKGKRVVITICFIMIYLLLITTMIRVFVKKMANNGIAHRVADVVFFDNKNKLNDTGQLAHHKYSIDWKKKYPMDDKGDLAKENNNKNDNSIITKYTSIVDKTKNKIDDYVSNYLIGHRTLLECAHYYNKIIDWNYSTYTEANSVAEIDDNYFVELYPKAEIADDIHSTIEFNDYCQKRKIDFLYVQVPYKVSEKEIGDRKGIKDYSNYSADDFLRNIKKAGVDCLDYRNKMKQSKKSFHNYFYGTDLHWKVEMGPKVAKTIYEYCNNNYRFNTDLKQYDIEKFRKREYKDWFLGYFGKKVTLAEAKPDDISLIYPLYPTKFHYKVPAEGIDLIGDYSVMYDKNRIEKKDYYKSNPYASCNYGNQPLINIENQLIKSNKKVLYIHDSYGICVTSCLALGAKQVDSIDLRQFDGSIKKYIEKTNPDLVILSYYPGSFEKVDYNINTSTFDFR